MQTNYHQKTIDVAALTANIAQVSENAKKGISYLVFKNNKPAFRILPCQNDLTKKYLEFFKKELKDTELYTDIFIKRIIESEKDMLEGRVKELDERY